MSRYLLLTLILIFSKPCFAQETRQQLYNRLAHNQPDTGRISLLQKIGNYYLVRYYETQQHAYIDSARDMFKRSASLSETIHLDDGNGRYESLRLVGITYLLGGDSITARRYITPYINYFNARHQYKRVMQGWMRYGESAAIATFMKLSLQCYRQAFVIAVKNKFVNDELNIDYFIVRRLFDTGKPDEGINYNLEIIKKFGRQKVNLDRQYLTMTRYYRYRGDIKRALQYCLLSINDMELYKDSVNAHIYYGEIAQIYEVLGETEKSINYYKRTVEQRIKIRGISEEQVLRTVGFIIRGLIKLGKFEEALNEAKAVEARKPPETIDGRAMIAQNKAYCYQALKNYPLAEKYYLEMINNFIRSGRHDEVMMLACYDIGSFYAAIKQYAKAQVYLRKLGDPLLSFDIQKNVELLRFRVDSGLGNYRGAMDYYIKYQKLKDSIVDEATSKQIAELQIKYETSQKEKDIAQLKRDALQADKVRNLTFIGVGLLLVALVLLYISYRGNQKKSREINLKNASLNQLLAEKDDLLEEKEWLIKEVHHRVKNNLQIVMGLLQRQSSFINNKEAFAAIQNSEHRMHSVALIHQKLYQSDSFMLVNMVDYINEMTGYLRDSFDMGEHISFDKQIEDINFEVNIAVPLGLILNEAITNAIKYAFPTREYGVIRIMLEPAGDDTYLLEISDNGRGLPADFDAQKNNSMGFNLMRGLSKQLNGTFSVVNDRGVAIKVLFRPEQHNA